MTAPDGSVIAWIAPDRSPLVSPVGRVPFSPHANSPHVGPAAGAGVAGGLRARVEDAKQPEAMTIIRTSAVFMEPTLSRLRVAQQRCFKNDAGKGGNRDHATVSIRIN